MSDLSHAELEDQAELYRGRDTRAADAWAELLKRYPAHCFCTFTFRPTKRFTDKHTGQVREVARTSANGGMHPEAADKGFRFFISSINRELYGNTWGKRWHRGLQWARGSEFHKDGRLHFHAIVSAPTGDLWKLTSIRKWHRMWLSEFGFNRIERPRSQADIAGYVSKYVAKDGVVDFSPNFGAWQPPPSDYLALPLQSELPGSRITDQAPTDSLQANATGRAKEQGTGRCSPFLTLPVPLKNDDDDETNGEQK